MKNNNIVLKVVFALLLLIVFILGIIYLTNNDKQSEKIDLSIPITEKNLNASFSVNIDDLNKNNIKKYVFDIKNNINNNINKSKILYYIEIKNSNNVETKTKLYKAEDKKNNLLNNFLITNNRILSNRKKQDDVYILEIKMNNKNINKKEKSYVMINIIGNISQN